MVTTLKTSAQLFDLMEEVAVSTITILDASTKGGTLSADAARLIECKRWQKILGELSPEDRGVVRSLPQSLRYVAELLENVGR